MKPIYLDYNATTPLDPQVADFMKPFLTEIFGNPSSSHYYGIQSRKTVDEARKKVADLINAKPNEIIFTSGGTESNNYAIKGIAYANQRKGNHIITSVIEHPAVIEVCKYLEKNGFEITYLPVDNAGMISLVDLKKSIKPETILISIMHANNEIGTIQPIEEIGKIAKEIKIYFHTDAAQSVGKIHIDVSKNNVDLLSIAGHKLYAPKGIGALYVKNGVLLEKFMHGANHENNRRAGTENILEIAGLGEACRIAGYNYVYNYQHLQNMRDLLYNLLTKSKLDFIVNGHPDLRLPNTLNISFKGLKADQIISILPEVAFSAGAACHSDSVKISRIIQEIETPEIYAQGTVRLSTGKFLNEKQVRYVAEIMISRLEKLQKKNN